MRAWSSAALMKAINRESNSIDGSPFCLHAYMIVKRIAALILSFYFYALRKTPVFPL